MWKLVNVTTIIITYFSKPYNFSSPQKLDMLQTYVLEQNWKQVLFGGGTVGDDARGNAHNKKYSKRKGWFLFNFNHNNFISFW